ncbi:MAG: DUF1302 family protein [Pseudomonadota bacterium]
MRTTLFIGLLFACGAAGATPWTVPLTASWGYGTDADDTMQTVLMLEPGADLPLNDYWTLNVDTRLWLDPDNQLEPGDMNRDSFAQGSRPLLLGDSGAIDLSQLTLTYRSDTLLLRLGKQRVNWGRLDGIKVLDVTHPQSFREFILDDFDQSRIALWGAYADLTVGRWRSEWLLNLDGSGHVIPDAGAWFELRAPRFRFGADPEQPSPRIITDSPGHGLSDSGFGIRLSRSLGAGDLSLLAYSGMDPEPLGRLRQLGSDAVVERYYERRSLAGASFETALGPLALRVEASLQPNRHFNTRDARGLQTVQRDQRRLAVGMDIDAPGQVFVNLQYLEDRISNAPSNLVRPARDRLATVAVRRSFRYDTLLLEARAYQSLQDSDRMTSLTLRYSLGDSTTIRTSVNRFSGTRLGVFGQFDGRDRITVSIEHVF